MYILLELAITINELEKLENVRERSDWKGERDNKLCNWICYFYLMIQVTRDTSTYRDLELN